MTRTVPEGTGAKARLLIAMGVITPSGADFAWVCGKWRVWSPSFGTWEVFDWPWWDHVTKYPTEAKALDALAKLVT